MSTMSEHTPNTLIRNEEDIIELSKKIAYSVEKARKERLQQAIEEDDWLYIDNLSTWELIRMLFDELKNLIKHRKYTEKK